MSLNSTVNPYPKGPEVFKIDPVQVKTCHIYFEVHDTFTMYLHGGCMGFSLANISLVRIGDRLESKHM